ncbi:LuxR C-terminal-related transcriptional regulator [Paenibacillus albidus]|uniref:LuxR C-terminal-related transcriptional regulator n=1 Tax=Paenibacillus albidus TaxID=2041023 RepID=UPI00203631AF|nr:LuxR C-terminal-related transcriptional regulator [Paenibacillus albidus]
MLCCRRETSLPKVKWQTSGWVLQLNHSQLRFNLAETSAFLGQFPQQVLGQAQPERLLELTEGWAAGLRLASLSPGQPQQPESWFPELPAGPGRTGQFLLEEVFSSLDAETGRFLMMNSMLERLHGSLCTALTGDENSGSRLEAAAAANLFLTPLDENSSWFRFHPLFAEFLNKELERREPGLTRTLLHKAAVWCEANGLEEDAVDYYLKGHYYLDAIALLEQMKALMIRKEFSTLRHWLSRIPEDLLRGRRYLYFSYIYALLWNNEPVLAENHLRLAREYYEAASPEWSVAERDAYLGSYYYVRNFKSTQYDLDVVKGLEYIRLSLQHSPSGTDLIFAPPHMPLCPSIFRSYNGKRGRHLPREIADPFFAGMIEFMAPMRIQESVLICYGELLYERNELAAAEDFLKRGLQENAQTRHQPEKVYVPAYLFLSRVCRARNEHGAAARWLEEAEQKARAAGERAALLLIETEMAASALERGDRHAALRWKERHGLQADDPVSVYQLFQYLFLVRVLMEEGQTLEALELAGRLLNLAEKGHRPMDALEAQILQSLLLERQGQQEQALLILEEALQYAETDDYIRIFADKGESLALLLKQYIGLRQKGHLRDKTGPSLAYIRRILACFADERDIQSFGRSRGEVLQSLLTAKEYRIYCCMEEGMDNKAIAESLSIGMGTLKTHINRIYSKLQVHNRVEALRRGKQWDNKNAGF